MTALHLDAELIRAESRLSVVNSEALQAQSRIATKEEWKVIKDIEWLAWFRETHPELADLQDFAWLGDLNNAKLLHVSPNNQLGCNDCSNSNLYLILDGSVRIYQPVSDGREFTLYRLSAGDICLSSYSGKIVGHGLKVLAESETAVSALVISESDFYQLMDLSEDFRKYVIKAFCRYMSKLANLSRKSILHPLIVRLADYLKNRFELGRSDTLEIKHQTIAQEFGKGREVISRALKELETMGCVALSRGTIRLVSARQLARVAQADACNTELRPSFGNNC